MFGKYFLLAKLMCLLFKINECIVSFNRFHVDKLSSAHVYLRLHPVGSMVLEGSIILQFYFLLVRHIFCFMLGRIYRRCSRDCYSRLRAARESKQHSGLVVSPYAVIVQVSRTVVAHQTAYQLQGTKWTTLKSCIQCGQTWKRRVEWMLAKLVSTNSET